MRISLPTLLPIILICGCATAPKGVELVERASQVTPMQQIYSKQLSQIKTGMHLEKFLTIFPESYVGGQSGNTTAYELTHMAKYVTNDDIDRQNIMWGAGSPRAREERQTLWFYFYNDKLVKWGKPGDWPPAPDKIIEVR
jgi:hypothetical protein